MIVPTIITADKVELDNKLRLLRGVSNLVQVDLVDGVFAQPKTIGLPELMDRPAGVEVELHLMVNRPEDWLKPASRLQPSKVIGQIEGMLSPQEFIKRSADLGYQPAIAFGLETPLTALAPECWPQLKTVLLMSVKAGSGGQEFDQRVLAKIETARRQGKDLLVGVDGGLNEENISWCREAGANVYYVGSAFWQAGELLARYRQLSYAAQGK